MKENCSFYLDGEKVSVDISHTCNNLLDWYKTNNLFTTEEISLIASNVGFLMDGLELNKNDFFDIAPNDTNIPDTMFFAYSIINKYADAMLCYIADHNYVVDKLVDAKDCENVYSYLDRDKCDKFVYAISNEGKPCVYKLTDAGVQNIKQYISELEAKRKEILDAGLDTASETLPTVRDIYETAIDFDFDEDGESIDGWDATDNYGLGYPICLKLGRDVEMIEKRAGLGKSQKKSQDNIELD